MKYKAKTYETKDLQTGFKGKSCSFEFKPFRERTEKAQEAFIALHRDLMLHGLKHPLITYKGHVLIGQRRFEMLAGVRDTFPCIEIIGEDIENWTLEDVRRLEKLKQDLYGAESILRFMG